MKQMIQWTVAILIAGTVARADVEHAHKAKAKCCVESAAEGETSAAALPDKSIYQTESKWTTDSGKSIHLSALKGKPQVVVMFFASCEFACPILVHDLKEIEAKLPENLRGKVGFTLVSFDSERDTAEALASFRKRMELGADWNLLRGESDDVLELTALLGVKFKKDVRGQFAHSNVITVLNAGGEIVKQINGLKQDPQLTIEALEKAIAPKTLAIQ